MKRQKILASVAAISAAISVPAIAGPGGGGGVQAGAAGEVTAGARGGISDTGATMREMGRMDSMGPDRASDRAIERANQNSVLRGETSVTTTSNGPSENAVNRRVNSQGAANANINALVNANPKSALGTAGVTTLTGLTTGLTVNNSGGESIGTVSQVLTNQAGAVVGIRVNLESGGSVVLPATTLSIDGSVVTTTSTEL